MKQRLFRTRRLGVALLAGVAALGAAATIGEGVASAAATTATASVATPINTSLGTNAAAVGSAITFNVSTTPASGDVVTLSLACPTAGSIGFNSAGTLPTGSQLTGTGWTISLVTSNNQCGTNVKNLMTITAGAGAASSFTLSPSYALNGVPSGTVTIAGSYASSSASTGISVPSDLTIVNATVSAVPPITTVPLHTNNVAVGNLTIAVPALNTTSNVIPSGSFVCVMLQPVGDNFDIVNGLPVVTQTNGAALGVSLTATAVSASTNPADTNSSSVQGNVLSFQVTEANLGTAPTFTISNIHADGNVAGTVSATVGYASSAANCNSTLTQTVLSSGAAFIVGAPAGPPIYGQTAVDTTAQEFLSQFGPTESGGTLSCGGNGNVVLATAADPYDALAASYLEGQLHTGVLITPPSGLDATVLAAIKSAGVARVYVVGGTLAITQAEITQLQATPAYNCGGFTPSGANLQVFSGISGPTADDTAVAIDNYITTGEGALPSVTGAYSTASTYNQTTGNATATAPAGTQTTAILVSDTDWQDAASIGGIAYAYHIPVILTPGNALGSQAAAELTKLGITQVIAMGGQLALQPAVVTSVQAMKTASGASISVLRIAGQDATQTAADVALFAGQQLGWKNTTVLAAQGKYWSDALGSAAISGNNQESLLLTEGPTVGVGQYTNAALKTAGTLPNGLGGGPTSAIQILGGPLAIPQAQITEMQASLAAG